MGIMHDHITIYGYNDDCYWANPAIDRDYPNPNPSSNPSPNPSPNPRPGPPCDM